MRICPICRQNYAERPATSREDNYTLICPDCGIRQSLSVLGISTEEQEKILTIIHSHTEGKDDSERSK